MAYFDLIKKAFRITFKHKYLWIFGLFAGLASVSTNISSDFSSGSDKLGKDFEEVPQQVYNFFHQPQFIILFIVIALAILALVVLFFLIGLVARAALIDSTVRIEENRENSFRLGLKAGLNKLVPMFLFHLALSLVSFIFVVCLALPVIFLFIFNMPIRALILLILAILIFIPFAIAVSFTQTYGERHLVINSKKFIEAIKLGFNSFKNNLWSSIICALINLVINFGLGLIIALLALLIIFPFAILGFAAYLAFKLVGVILVIAVGGLIFFLALLGINAVIQTFISTFWTLIFRRLKK